MLDSAFHIQEVTRVRKLQENLKEIGNFFIYLPPLIQEERLNQAGEPMGEPINTLFQFHFR